MSITHQTCLVRQSLYYFIVFMKMSYLVFIVQGAFWSKWVQALSVSLPHEKKYLLMCMTLSEFMVLAQAAGL